MLYIGYLIIFGSSKYQKIDFWKFYCLRQFHLAENLLQTTHTQNREKTTYIRPKKCFT